LARRGGGREARRGLTKEAAPPDHRTRHIRLPPGQHTTNGWPVLDLGVHPSISLTDWTLSIDGHVEQKVSWAWTDYLNQPRIKLVTDFHCVTSWSTFDNAWEGVGFRHILSLVRPAATVRFVLFTSYDGYTTNLPLEACDDDDV